MMWEIIVAFIVGAAVPIFINWLQRRDVRKQFDLQRKDKYKLVAVEKRLEVHQQAFSQWCKLKDVIHEKDVEKRGDVINTASEFYCHNCLYLEKRSREEFRIVIHLVSNYPTFLENWKHRDPGPDKEEAHKDMIDAWNRIFKFPEIIQSDVELEPIKMETEDTPEGEKSNETSEVNE